MISVVGMIAVDGRSGRDGARFEDVELCAPEWTRGRGASRTTEHGASSAGGLVQQFNQHHEEVKSQLQ